jgi:hypothetical protein
MDLSSGAWLWVTQAKQEALMFQRTRMTAKMSQELIDILTDSGQRDLTKLRLDDLENEVCQLVDEVTCRTMRGVLEDQANDCDLPTDCPRCGKLLIEKPPQETTLTCERGEVAFHQPVKRCTTCRCDFFPSGESHGD